MTRSTQARTEQQDSAPRRSELDRQQAERSNRAGFEDYRTEGNVVEAACDAEPPSVTIGMRDGLQRVVLQGDAAKKCGSIRVGDYLEAEGAKEHEGLFYADDVSRSRVR